MTQSLHAMVPIEMFIVEHAMERYRDIAYFMCFIELFCELFTLFFWGILRNGDHMDMDSLAVLDSCRLMEQRKLNVDA